MEMHPPVATERAAESVRRAGWRCEKILVVVDPTVEHHACIEKAVRIALQYQSELELFICDTEDSVPEHVAAAVSTPAFRQQLARQRLDQLEALAGPLRATDLTVTTSATWDADLASGIGNHTIRTRPDLVIKDTHHHLPMPRVNISYTDTTLIRQLPAPLLLVHDTVWQSPTQFAVAIDPTQQAERSVAIDDAMLEVASSLAGKLRGALEIVHVFRDPPHFPDEFVSSSERERAQRQSRAQVMSVVQRHDPSLVVHFEDGAVARSLLDFASKQQPDILFMGVAPRARWINQLPGGTASRLLEHLNCDLLLVKPPGFVSGLLITE